MSWNKIKIKKQILNWQNVFEQDYSYKKRLEKLRLVSLQERRMRGVTS